MLQATHLCDALWLVEHRCNHNHRPGLSPRVLTTTFSQNDLLTFFHFVKERITRDQVVRTKHCTQCFVLLPDYNRLWWRMTGSNRRPPACKAGALPAELIPRLILTIIRPLQSNSWWVWLESNQRPPPYQDDALTN